MIPLVIIIMLLSLSILISRQYILIREWYIWACMLTETYMRGESDQSKLKVLLLVGAKKFPFAIRILPKSMLCSFIQYAEKDFRNNDHSMRNYHRIVQGIEQYDDDYTTLLELIDHVCEEEEA